MGTVERNLQDGNLSTNAGEISPELYSRVQCDISQFPTIMCRVMF